MLLQLSALIVPFLLSQRVAAVPSVPCAAGTYKQGSVCFYCPAGTFNSRQYRTTPFYLTTNIRFVMQKTVLRPRARQLAQVSRSA